MREDIDVWSLVN